MRGLFIAAIIFVIIIGGIAIYEEVKWAKWASVHCKKIGEISGSTGIGPTIGSNGSFGITTIITPGKTGYRCDDGIDYWK